MTPMVFGSISEKMSMTRVKQIEKRINHFCPKSAAAKAPLSAAPRVLAIVLSERMAVMGLCTCMRSCSKSFPDPCPAFIMREMALQGVAYSTASNREHMAEMASADTVAITRCVMLLEKGLFQWNRTYIILMHNNIIYAGVKKCWHW